MAKEKTGGFRQLMAPVHTWTGLILGWVLYFMFLTGTAGYFNHEIDDWMRPEKPRPAPEMTAPQLTAVAIGYLKQSAPDAKQWTVMLPHDRMTALRVSWQPKVEVKDAVNEAVLDPRTGKAVTGVRETGGGTLLYAMHYLFHYMPTQAAYWLAGIASMAMLVAIITGVIVHKKIFADFFTLRLGKGQRSWLDGHNVLGVLALPFHIMITWTGLLYLGFTYTSPLIATHYGWGKAGSDAFYEAAYAEDEHAEVQPSGRRAALASVPAMMAQADALWGAGKASHMHIDHPFDAHALVSIDAEREGVGDTGHFPPALHFNGVTGALIPEDHEDKTYSFAQRIDTTVLSLHEGKFAGIGLRWLYVLSGLGGTALIGTGLVLWTAKRRVKLPDPARPYFGFQLVEKLNVATIAGLPAAIAAYFLANRLLPVAMPGRGEWEAHVLFLTWLGLSLWTLWRPARKAWSELWGAGAILCLAVPVVNALTTARGLNRSLSDQDWLFAGFDLTLLGFAAFGAFMARQAWRKGAVS